MYVRTRICFHILLLYSNNNDEGTIVHLGLGIKTLHLCGDQDRRGVLHTYIKNASICGTIFTEHL